MGRAAKVIVINDRDNVATALEPLQAGNEVSVSIRGRIEKIRLVSDIPAGHKFALWDVEKGEALFKYGEPIGQSRMRINRGEHVHVHNVTQPASQGGA